MRLLNVRIEPVSIALLAVFLSGASYCQIDPATAYGGLFKQVQLLPVFRDSKKFPDCIPRFPPQEIVKKFDREKGRKGFDLRAFVAANFDTLLENGNDTARLLRHIDMLWSSLERPADSPTDTSSLIPLPHPYIVPGGRFREIYYWDSYFTMLGLAEAGRTALIKNMLDDFCYLIDRAGHIPNGNRTYYLSRSQPPFFSLMVDLLARARGEKVLDDYLPWLEKEYAFWMKGKEALGKNAGDTLRVVSVGDGMVLNRYFDALDVPRPESFKEDSRLAESVKDRKKFCRDVRSAAESGWDFSSRWFADQVTLASIHTTDIVPVDLNCLLYHLESLLAEGYARQKSEKSHACAEWARLRKQALIKCCWSDSAGFFLDYDFKKKARTPVISMAGAFPLFFKIPDSARARIAIRTMKLKLLKAGGLATTETVSGQQWDAPNGWAPLQWIGYIAFKNYGDDVTARDAAKRWIGLNCKTFFATGKMMEKYNVINLDAPGGGGEYDLQDGFGWTNGVFLKLWKEMQ
jgi:alpha,alpha-trehalase